MATYIPNATQTTEPVESRTVESAALEFRTLKASVNARVEAVQGDLANLQTQNNSQDVRLTAIENALPFIGEGGLPGTVYVQRLSGTGAQTVFTLNTAPQSNNVVDIYINGIYQNKDTFTISGADVIFSEAPPAGTNNIEVQVTVTIALGETDASLVTYGAATVADQLDAISTAGGSSLVGFQQAGTGAVAATVQAKLRETVSVKDFGAVGDGVADDYSAFDQANTNGAFQIPPGTYKIGTNLTLTNKVSFMPGATLAPDAGVTIVFADGQGEIDVQWFGAKGDGVTDDTTAIQNAINSGYDIFLPPTNAGYKVAGNGTGQRLLIPARRNIYGDFFKTKILHSNDNWLFEIRGSFIGVSRLQIDAGAATTSGRGQFLIRSDLSGLERIWLKEIETDQSFQFLRDSKSGVNLIVNLQLEDVICRRHRGNGLDLEDGFAYCRFTNVTVDYVNSVSKNHTAYRVLNNAGSVWTNVDVTGGQVDGTTSSQHGFFFDNCIAVWMNNCMADTVGGHGFYFFSDCRAFYMSQCISSLNGLAGFYMAGSGNINNMFVNCVCGGRKNQSYSVPLQAGWFVLNGVGTQLTGCKSVENTGAGMYFQDSIITNVTGGTIASNTTWGIETLGTNGGIYSAVSINQPSSSGNASLATTIDHLVNCQLTSGIVGNLTGPGTI